MLSFRLQLGLKVGIDLVWTSVGIIVGLSWSENWFWVWFYFRISVRLMSREGQNEWRFSLQ